MTDLVDRLDHLTEPTEADLGRLIPSALRTRPLRRRSVNRAPLHHNSATGHTGALCAHSRYGFL